MIKVTVVTTTYNQEKYIRQALENIVNQKTDFQFQAIVSDDCSTDGTSDIIREFHKKYPNIIKPIFNKKNLGAMGNFVETLNKVNTEYVAFCDGDDYWTDATKLQKQFDFLKDNSEYSICFHSTEIFYENNEKKEEIYPLNISQTATFDDLIKQCYIPANTVMYRWLFKKPDSFKKEFPKDIVPGDYFVHLMHAKKGKIKYLPFVMSRYRRHDQGMWWLTSDASKEEEFALKYGTKYLRFFKCVESKFELPNTTFEKEKKYLTHNIVIAFIKNKKIKELYDFYLENAELSNEVLDEISFEPVYNEYGKVKRILYYIIFEPKIFRTKLINKLKKIFIR